MKTCLNFVVLAVIAIFTFQSVYACSVVVVPLRKQFRRADNVFFAKVEKVEPYSPSAEEWAQLPEFWSNAKKWDISKVRFKVSKTWRGASKGDRVYLTDWDLCGCEHTGARFEVGREYLVFANDEFVTTCSASQKDLDDTMKILDRFWFRTWATIYPF